MLFNHYVLVNSVLTLKLRSSGKIPDVTVGLEGYGKMDSNDISIDAENILHVCVSSLAITLGYHVNFNTFPVFQASDVFMCWIPR